MPSFTWGLKPQSEQPRPQNRTRKQKQTETQIRETIEKYIFDSSFDFRGEGSPSFGHGSIQNEQVVHRSMLSAKYDGNKSDSVFLSYFC